MERVGVAEEYVSLSAILVLDELMVEAFFAFLVALSFLELARGLLEQESHAAPNGRAWDVCSCVPGCAHGSSVAYVERCFQAARCFDEKECQG